MFHFDVVKSVSFISIRFKSGAFRHFTSKPFSELNNGFVSIQELWEDKGDQLLIHFKKQQVVNTKLEVLKPFYKKLSVTTMMTEMTNGIRS
ncbi:MAG: hypothetical protein ACJA1H_000846 [Glaciecola sp.]|jgi:hypothetical protein